jgi:putative ABC transport system ATP-binding protein
MSATPLLTLRDVGQVFGRGPGAVRALDGVDLRLDPGEVTLIVGPSGSGKTTLLMIAGAMLTATTGRVSLQGIALRDQNARELAQLRLMRIGFVFQSFNLFPALSALDNVALPAALAGVPRRERRRRAVDLLQGLGLGERMTHIPEELSAGEKQRVAMARALVNDPPLLLADEPTANLDSTSGRTVLAILREIASREGRGVLVVTHDVRLIDSGDRVLELVDGRLSESLAAAGRTGRALKTAPGDVGPPTREGAQGPRRRDG